MKRIVYELIEKGYNNADIAAAVNISTAQVRNMRTSLSRASGIKYPSRPSKCQAPSAPKEGTMSRAVYDLIKSGVDDAAEIRQLTGAAHGIIRAVKVRCFGYKPKRVDTTYAPTEGTKSREVFELLSMGETDLQKIRAQCNVAYSLIRGVKMKYFTYKKRQYNKFSAMRTIELSELRP
jgi:hypothetical protein